MHRAIPGAAVILRRSPQASAGNRSSCDACLVHRVGRHGTIRHLPSAYAGAPVEHIPVGDAGEPRVKSPKNSTCVRFVYLIPQLSRTCLTAKDGTSSVMAKVGEYVSCVHPLNLLSWSVLEPDSKARTSVSLVLIGAAGRPELVQLEYAAGLPAKVS